MSRAQLLVASALLIVAALVVPARGQHVEDSIDVWGNFVGSMIYNPISDVVYGCTNTGNRFFAISCSHNMMIVSSYLTYPGYMTYSSTDNKAYCSYGAARDSLVVVSGVTHRAVKRLRILEANVPVWDSIGNRVYVSCTENNSVAVIDCVTDSVIANIAVGAAPIKMHVNPLRRKLYVQNYDANSVSIIDMTTNQVIRTRSFAYGVESGWYDSEQDRYYVGSPEQTSVLDGQTDSVLYSISVGQQNVAQVIGGGVPGLVAMGTYEQNRLYVASRSTGFVKSTELVGQGPIALAWNTEGGRLYCANEYSGDVTVLTGDGYTVLRTLPVGDYPFCLAYSPVERRLYVGHLNGRWVYVIKDTMTGLEEASAGAAPRPALHAEPSVFSGSVRLDGASTQEDGSVELCVRSACGQLVRTLRATADAAGRWSCDWDGRDEHGRQVPAGVYLLSIVGNERRCVKVVKLR